MLSLVGNEWRKEFGKISIRIAVILLGAITVLTALLGAFDFVSPEFVGGQSFREFCENEIAWNEEMLLTGKDDEESLAFYRIQIETHRMMLAAGMDWGDWRYAQDLAYKAVEAKAAGNIETYNALYVVIFSNDPAAYFAWQKKYYENRYAGDAELAKIYVSAADFCINEGVIPYAAADWRYGEILSMTNGEETALRQERLRDSGGAWSEGILEDARNTAAVAKYRLENNMEVNPADSFRTEDWSTYLYGYSDVSVGKTSPYWNAMVNSEWLLSVVTVLIVIVAGGTVANEFTAGTIKFLLMSPVRRWKILFSKYAMVLSLAFALCLSVGLLSAVGALPLGVGDVLLPAVFAKGGEIYTLSPYLLMLGNYGIVFLELCVMSTLAFALSALTRRASGAIGITVFLYLSGSMIASLFSLFELDFGRYLLFSNLDLAAIADGRALFAHQSLGGAIVIIVLHMAVFLLTAHDAFVRREV